ncbi:MAG: hypothetical protein CFE44_12925 [Burkholderiales bacterium PBB4]|nr:MAG: hypothetical protein CFE44_12925 [Burkholderiales bacterium PBB4]
MAAVLIPEGLIRKAYPVPHKMTNAHYLYQHVGRYSGRAAMSNRLRIQESNRNEYWVHNASKVTKLTNANRFADERWYCSYATVERCEEDLTRTFELVTRNRTTQTAPISPGLGILNA